MAVGPGGEKLGKLFSFCVQAYESEACGAFDLVDKEAKKHPGGVGVRGASFYLKDRGWYTHRFRSKSDSFGRRWRMLEKRRRDIRLGFARWK